MSSILRRVAFALKFSSIKIILNTDINRDSRIMYYRGVKERLNKICPFIAFDRDPYIVVSAGRLYWLCDGYTVSSSYPYSQPVSGDINYIRNSVKAVVDAYDGSVNLYVSDRDDPVIRTYCGMFPGVFKPLEEMSADLKAHLRYPEEMFKMQTAIYSIYHMDEPQNFYNKEDVWNIPNEVFEQGEQPIEPYYIILKLPGEDREEFMLMQPLTPMSKSNLAAWFCVRCDYPGYGKLTAFRFPKKELVYGPMQIEARIDQDPVISQQLSLWGQRGSQVIRGNLLVIPIENSLIYIEPLYLKAERGQLPELKWIIVAYKNHIAMEEDLPTALKKALTGAETTVDNVENIPSRQQSVSELASEALKHFNKAGDFTRKNDWSGFGEELKKVGDLLEKLKQTAGK
jgi:uncharacterized protein